MKARPKFARLIAPFSLAVVVTLVLAGFVLHAIGRDSISVGKICLVQVVTAALIVFVHAMIWRRSSIARANKLSSLVDRMAAGEWSLRAAPADAREPSPWEELIDTLAAGAERQLADLGLQRADLQALIDSLPDPILAIDAQRRVMLINRPATQLLLVTRPQTLGKNVVSVVNEESILQVLDEVLAPTGSVNPNVSPSAASGIGASPQSDYEPVTRPREVRLMRNGQRGTFQAVALRAARGGVLLVLRDVSALSGAMQMKTDFVANASHELRTPLAAIKIAFETLRDVYREDAHQTQKCIVIIDGHIKRLEEMLRDLLDLSRVESADLKPHVRAIAPADIFGQVRAGLGSMARQKNLTLTFESPTGDHQPMFTDQRLLMLTLKNLVENSIKYTPAGGNVSVSLTVDMSDIPPDVHQRMMATEANSKLDQPPTRWSLLKVADTGIGIAPEHVDRVFERFYQVEAARTGAAGRGTGLGLAIVKHAVHALGGQIWVDSTLGAGTTITCLFPQIPPEQSVE